MITIKNHADFKRVLKTKEVVLETLALASNVSAGRLNVGDIRYINIADTVGVYLKKFDDDSIKRGSFLGYDKASNWVFNNDIATHKFGMSYRIVEKGQG
jgi:hypothetical protein